MHCGMIHEIITKAIYLIKKIKIKMLSYSRIEPTTAGVVACIKIVLVTWKTNLRSTLRPLRSHTV